MLVSASASASLKARAETRCPIGRAAAAQPTDDHSPTARIVHPPRCDTRSERETKGQEKRAECSGGIRHAAPPTPANSVNAHLGVSDTVTASVTAAATTATNLAQLPPPSWRTPRPRSLALKAAVQKHRGRRTTVREAELVAPRSVGIGAQRRCLQANLNPHRSSQDP